MLACAIRLSSCFKPPPAHGGTFARGVHSPLLQQNQRTLQASPCEERHGVEPLYSHNSSFEKCCINQQIIDFSGSSGPCGCLGDQVSIWTQSSDISRALLCRGGRRRAFAFTTHEAAHLPTHRIICIVFGDSVGCYFHLSCPAEHPSK